MLALCPCDFLPMAFSNTHSLFRAFFFFFFKGFGILLEVRLFFGIAEGPQTGQAASSASISRWIRETIVQANAIEGRGSPLLCYATLYQGVSASWAFGHQMLVSQV